MGFAKLFGSVRLSLLPDLGNFQHSFPKIHFQHHSLSPLFLELQEPEF